MDIIEISGKLCEDFKEFTLYSNFLWKNGPKGQKMGQRPTNSPIGLEVRLQCGCTTEIRAKGPQSRAEGPQVAPCNG